VIRTADGDELLLAIHGQSVLERGPASRRVIRARVELTTDADRHRWLNLSFLVGDRDQ
jgi:hypothetical protein